DPETIAHLPFEKHLRAATPVVAPAQAQLQGAHA
ncbi:TPA: GNAT family N-acetyltransferase, partial [Stenotrophomonas maltophilia]